MEAVVFLLRLEKTYCQYGYFNVRVTHDHLLRQDEGPVTLLLNCGRELPACVHRTANSNWTGRVRGNAALRDWFQEHYRQGNVVPVTFESATRLRLG